MKVRHYYCSFQILLLLLSFFIITISVVDAQQPSDSTPSSTVVDDGDDYELEGKGVNPSMAIIIIVLVLGFFITGCISIYVQQCSDNSSIGERPVVGQPMMMRAVQRGVDQSVIDTFPTFLYSDVKELKIGKGALECAICINEFEVDETLRLLPVCDHVFHHECIDAWLVAHATCPVCRANLVADTGELSKVENNNDHSELSPSDHYLVEVTVEAEPPKGRVPRSHSTGHSLVRVIRPNEDRERFTLRLPDEVRKQLLVARPRLKRTTSLVALPRVSSSRRGYRGGGEGSGSSRYGRFFGRWTTKTNGSDGDASTGSKRFSRTAVTPLESLPNLPV